MSVLELIESHNRLINELIDETCDYEDIDSSDEEYMSCLELERFYIYHFDESGKLAPEAYEEVLCIVDDMKDYIFRDKYNPIAQGIKDYCKTNK